MDAAHPDCWPAFTRFRGDTKRLPFILTDDLGTVLDPDAHALFFAVEAPDGTRLINKQSQTGGFTTIDAATGSIEVQLLSLDDALLENDQEYAGVLVAVDNETDARHRQRFTLTVKDGVVDEPELTIPTVVIEADSPYLSAIEIEANKDAAVAAASATAADRVQTGIDAAATAADRVQTGLDRVATGQDKTGTAADRVQTGLDRVATGQDKTATAADRVQTGLDRVATGQDKTAADADAVATAADRVQTGLDRTAASNSAAAAAASAGTAAAISANVRNALAPQAALACDGAAAANRLTWALPASCALGTDPRGFTKKIETPAAAPAATAVLFTWGDAASPTTQFFEIAHTSGDALRFRIYGATTADYRERTFAGFISNYGALRTAIITVAMSSAGLVVIINGVTATLTAETTGGTPPTDWQGALTSTVAAWHGGVAHKLYSWFPTNFAPVLADALDIFFLGGGVPQRMKWGGTAVNTTAPSIYNPGGKTINSSTATVFDVTAGAVNSNCYYAHRPSRSMPAGQLIRLSGIVASISQPDNVSVSFGLGDLGTYGSGAGLVADSTGGLNTGGSTTSRFCENTTTAFSVTWSRVSPPSSAVEVVINIRKTASASINSLKVDVLGALFFASPHASGDGCGYQLHDVGSNQVDGLMPTAGWSWTHPTQRGYIRGTTSTNGNQQLAGGVLLPANCQITRIRQKTGSGTPNTTLGTASGGAQLMASAAQSTTWKDETLALTGGINTAANSVWVGSNTTDTVYTHATYEILS